MSITKSITLNDLYEQKLVVPENKINFNVKDKQYAASLVCVDNVAQLQIVLNGKTISAPNPRAFYKAVVEELFPGSPEIKALTHGKSSQSFRVRRLCLKELKKRALAAKIMRNPKIHSVSTQVGYVVAYTSDTNTQQVEKELSEEFKNLQISVVYEQRLPSIKSGDKILAASDLKQN